MYTNHAAPGLTELITCRLFQWRDQTGFFEIPEMDYSLQEALQQQDFLEWDNFCFGLVGKSMVKAHQDYLTLRENCTPAHVWFS